MEQFLFERVENILGNGENAGNQHFLLYPKCFQKALSSEASKVLTEWESYKCSFFSQKHRVESLP